MSHPKDVIIVPTGRHVNAPHGQAKSGQPSPLPLLALLAGLAGLVLVDKLVGYLNPFRRVPHTLLGVFAIVTGGVWVRFHNQKAYEGFMAFITPAHAFITHTYLPLFYSPALVLLPTAMPLEAISGDLVARIVLIIAVGCLATALFTSMAVWSVRTLSKNEHPVPPSEERDDVRFSKRTAAGWLVGALICSTIPHAARLIALGQIMLSIGVYMISMSIPKLHRILHPMVQIAVAVNVHALLLARVHHGHISYAALIDIYSETARPLLFSFLGPIILCFAVSIVSQWTLVTHHKLELILACSSSAAFTMISTALISIHVIPLHDRLLTRSLLSRGMTLALALVNTDLVQGDVSITAAGVACTGLIGSMILRPFLNTLNFKDVIVRGVTSSAVAHGLGAAVLGQAEPDALPYAG